MKKSKIKLSLNKRSISTLETSSVKGGITGTTCEITNKYYNTCYTDCPVQATWWDCFTLVAECNTIRVCDH